MMRRFFVISFVLSLIFQPIFHAEAEECNGTTCIDVSTDRDREVVITVRKKSPGATVKPTPRTTTQVSKRPTPARSRIVVTPSPRNTPRTSTPTPRRTTRPRVKTSPTEQQISSADLFDQVRSLIPTGSIHHQPTTGILVREPVYFRTSVPNRFSTVVVVLDIPIQIDLHATYRWSFGDGSFISTVDQGNIYPISAIRHSFDRAGRYPLNLQVLWSGNWRSGALSGAINGQLTQNFSTTLEIFGARSRVIQ